MSAFLFFSALLPLLSVLIHHAEQQSTLGFDTTAAISTSVVPGCIAPNGSYTYFLFRLISAGTTDNTGVSNVVVTRQADAGVNTDCWVDPQFASGKKIVKQVKQAVKALNTALAAIQLDPSFGCTRVFVNVSSGVTAWTAKMRKNANLITAYIKGIKKRRLYYGIMTNSVDWTAITGGITKFKGKGPKLSQASLLWRHVSNSSVGSGFTTFGPWTAPTFQQYKVQTTVKCGKNNLTGDLLYVRGTLTTVPTTTTPRTTTTTTSTVCASKPNNAASLVLGKGALANNTVAGTCPCSNVTQKATYFYSFNTTYAFFTNTSSANLTCSSSTPIACICGEDGFCYAGSAKTTTIYFYAYCSAALGCHTYTYLYNYVTLSNGQQVNNGAQSLSNGTKTYNSYAQNNFLIGALLAVSASCVSSSSVCLAMKAPNCSGNGVFTAPAPTCSVSNNAAGLVIGSTESLAFSYTTPIASCLCSDSVNSLNYFPSLNSTYPFYPSPLYPGTALLSCVAPNATACVCGEDGTCYAGSTATTEVFLFSYCSQSLGCHMYAYLQTLYTNSKGVLFTVAAQSLSNGVTTYSANDGNSFVTSSLLAVSVSCVTSAAICTAMKTPVCNNNGAFTAAPVCSIPTNAVGVVLGSTFDYVDYINSAAPIGSCACSDGQSAISYFSPINSTYTSSPFSYSVNATCAAANPTPCLCGEDGNCYAGDALTKTVALFPYCSTALGCHMYSYMISNSTQQSLSFGTTNYTSPTNASSSNFLDNSLAVVSVSCEASIAVCQAKKPATCPTKLTYSPSSSSPTCTNTANTAGIILGIGSAGYVAPSGSCPCSRGTKSKVFFPSVASSSELTTAAYSYMLCSNPVYPVACICGEDGSCYAGNNSTGTVVSGVRNTINFFPYCSSAGCHMYTYLYGTNQTLTNSVGTVYNTSSGTDFSVGALLAVSAFCVPTQAACFAQTTPNCTGPYSTS